MIDREDRRPRFFVYPGKEVMVSFANGLAAQFPVYLANDRTLAVIPDPRDGAISRYHLLRDTFLDIGSVADPIFFPPVTPDTADYFIVPIIIESNELQPRTRALNPAPEEAVRDLLACLPYFNRQTSPNHILFFYDDQFSPPRCVEGCSLFLVSCHRATKWQACPYHSPYLLSGAVPLGYPSISEARLLFAFQGQGSVALRRQLAAKVSSSSQPNYFVINQRYFELYSPEERSRLGREWLVAVANSQFILCPRGEGLSSIRLFDAMALGRVPVVMGDDAKLPLADLIDYDSLAVRVPESNLEQLEEAIIDFKSAFDLAEVSLRLRAIAKRYFSSWGLRDFIEAALASDSVAEPLVAEGGS